MKEADKVKEAIEEIFNIFATRSQTMIDMKPYNEESIRNMPADVATPFPPLNFNQTGYVWPNIQQKTAIKLIDSGKKYFIKPVKSIPFMASQSNVRKANFLSVALKTLVAPVLFDPKLRRSNPLKCLTRRKPVGMEPIKYPKIHKMNSDILIISILYRIYFLNLFLFCQCLSV